MPNIVPNDEVIATQQAMPCILQLVSPHIFCLIGFSLLFRIMFSKQQASHLRQEFWTAFGRYMRPVLSAEGKPVNWVNYKTGAKHIAFRMNAAKGAYVAIELSHPDAEARSAGFEKLQTFRQQFVAIAGDGWEWEPDFVDEHGKVVSRIVISLEGVHIFNKADWPSLISFFKNHIISLDAFWCEVKFAFDVWED